MSDKYRVGIIGVGLMGHGIAKNVIKGGYALTFLDHPGNRPTDTLTAEGARAVSSVRAVAEASDVIILCVTGSPQVEAVVLGEQGLAAALGAGQVVVDCSTAQPASTRRVAGAVAARGARFLDAPMTRTPKEAEEGRLNLMVGGDPGTLDQVRALLETFAENIFHAGPTGAGHTLKLLHNFVSLGNSVLLAEASACARRGGVDMATFVDVLATGGGNSVVLDRLAPFILDGDDSNFRFTIDNSHKDMGYYTALADGLSVPSFAAHAVHQVYALAQALGNGGRPVPALVDVLDKMKPGE